MTAHTPKAIPFNRPPVLGNEVSLISAALARHELSGAKHFSKQCEAWFQEKLSAPRAIITPSCTAALEMAALLLDCGPGDEIIMPSFTFVSTANAFALRGARIVFCDIDPATMNIRADALAAAITPKTKAVVVVHYGGVGCDMQKISTLVEKHDLFLVEDAAQAILAGYCDRPLGSFGHLSCFSFHETKNVVCGEGGMLVINDPRFIARAEILQEKGTNRRAFINGLADKYTWVDVGSSYLPSEIQAAFLYAQLSRAQEITDARLAAWNYYDAAIKPRAKKWGIEHSLVPQHCSHNAHLYFIKPGTEELRDGLISFARDNGVQMPFHYVPLHSSPAGQKHGSFSGEDRFTTDHSRRLLRLPLFMGITHEEQDRVIGIIEEYMEKSP